MISKPSTRFLANKFMISSSTQMHKFKIKMYPIVDQMFQIYIFQMATCAIGLAFLTLEFAHEKGFKCKLSSQLNSKFHFDGLHFFIRGKDSTCKLRISNFMHDEREDSHAIE
jgi:hypothetical protein